MHLAHHKNEEHWGHTPIVFVLRDEAEVLAIGLVRMTIRWLLFSHSNPAPNLFLNASGRPIGEAAYSGFFNDLVFAGTDTRICPQKLRHIFVDERRSRHPAAGPADDAAAFVMGHSTKAWTNAYDLSIRRRSAQEAVDNMAAWREGETVLPAGIRTAAFNRTCIGSSRPGFLLPPCPIRRPNLHIVPCHGCWHCC